MPQKRDEVHTQLERAKDTLTEVRKLLRELPERVETWIAGLGGTTGAHSPPVTTVDPATRPGLPPGVAAAVADLPPPVPKRQSGQTQKITHGRILDVDGAIVGRLVSGTDADSAAADRLIADAGFRQQLGIGLHVALKALAQMHASGQRHLTLVVNNRPCPGPFGCDKILPRLLRPDETVTIYGPEGFHNTYRRTAP
ncbi:DddA-like double-stranded DNA deaminase toxin [Allokutzneria albata]|uniref:SCP1.201-like deaminase n=1 Tax=Allokutzneria albata TaxID=211114 RepID=A0A1G9SAW4_ALLAB|nr:DddA-like double-stranded DNA deaminase toxin [Allokutzneria albata]SDM31925.1 SCP1.201-like deaminase [Allokutzneria albata]